MKKKVEDLRHGKAQQEEENTALKARYVATIPYPYRYHYLYLLP